jgi:hypothetical protein
MGRVKALVIERMELDELFRLACAAEEDRRREPVLPDPAPVKDGQDAQRQDGGSVPYPFIFERSSSYASAIHL